MLYLNLEVVLGMIALARLASSAMGVELSWSWYAVVPGATWALYIFDRLYDIRSSASVRLTGRHEFHRRHKKLLATVATVLLLASGVVAAIYFPLTYWIVAACLGLLLLFHAGVQRYFSRSAGIAKDINVAVTYTAASWCIPAIMRVEQGSLGIAGEHVHGIVYVLIVFTALLALVLADVILLSRLDAASDKQHGLPSIAVSLGHQHARTTLIVLLATSAALSVVLWVLSGAEGLMLDGRIRPSIILLLMTSAYAVLSLKAPKNPDVARWAFESVLWLGLLA